MRDDLIAGLAAALLVAGLALGSCGCASNKPPDYDGPAYPIERAVDPVTGKTPSVRVVP
jgi:hypothetical protein